MLGLWLRLWPGLSAPGPTSGFLGKTQPLSLWHRTGVSWTVFRTRCFLSRTLCPCLSQFLSPLKPSRRQPLCRHPNYALWGSGGPRTVKLRDRQLCPSGANFSVPCRTSSDQRQSAKSCMSAVASRLGNLDLRFAKKSTNTLLNRVSSLQRFAAWLLRSFPHEPLSEALVFLYCQNVTSQVTGSSVPDQLSQALNFADGCLGLHVAASSLLSQRVQGLAHQAMRQQRPPRQAPALTTDQVRWLQTRAGSDEPQYECYVAATLLFMVYARARHSDLRRSQSLLVDTDDSGRPVFIECEVLNPKQSKQSRRRNMFLPLVAPAEGICQEPWAERWLELRKSLGLKCHGSLEDDPLLPDLAADGSLLKTNMDAATTTKWMRCLLSRQPGSSAESLLKMSSQGLKATCLSWTMKAGIPDPRPDSSRLSQSWSQC